MPQTVSTTESTVLSLQPGSVSKYFRTSELEKPIYYSAVRARVMLRHGTKKNATNTQQRRTGVAPDVPTFSSFAAGLSQGVFHTRHATRCVPVQVASESRLCSHGRHALRPWRPNPHQTHPRMRAPRSQRTKNRYQEYERQSKCAVSYSVHTNSSTCH